jgi:hypothetical protein
MLGAHGTLIKFPETERSIPDPIERVGEDAVFNAAALALVRLHEPRVFEVLLRLAHRPCLSGALAGFGRAEAIHLLISPLEKDGNRLTRKPN